MCAKTSATSGPTWYPSKEIDGPTNACTDDAVSKCISALAMTPLARPFQPACTAANLLEELSKRSIGTQSATSMQSTTLLSAVTSPSASVSVIACAASTTSLLCTCLTMMSFSAPMALATRFLFSATSSGLSPTWMPRLSDSYGPSLTPPKRSVMNASIPNFLAE